jgi:hypothetical protein
LAAGLDKIANLEGTKDQQHDAGGEVAQRTLQRKADGETGGAQDRQETGGLNTELAEDRNPREDDDGVFRQAREKSDEGCINPIGSLQTPGNNVMDSAGKP